MESLTSCKRQVLKTFWRSVSWGLVAALTVGLEGCWEETCELDPSGIYTSCSYGKQCAIQDSPYIMEKSTLTTCFEECAYQNCTVVMLDCDGRCLLLQECGSEVEASCGSQNRIFYMNMDMMTTTTTTTTILGACFDGMEPNENYVCDAASYCRFQVSQINFGRMSLSACLAECDLRGNCRAVQYNCAGQCWSLSFGCEATPSQHCGSSVYHKAALTQTTSVSLAVSTTSQVSTRQDLSATCFNGVVDDGTYRCAPMSHCTNQAFATYMGKMTLAECMTECSQDADCTALLHECTGVCELLLGVNCQDSFPFTSADGFRGGCGTLYTKALATTTQVPSGCFSGLQSGAYDCQPFKTCAEPANSLHLGKMSLQSCMAQCESYDCAAIQFNCEDECELLTSCPELVPSLNSSCTRSVYLRDQLWPGWVETTTTTTVPGQCRPNARTPLLDFSCQPDTYCIEQISGPKYSDVSIERCAELCRVSLHRCEFFQYDCNNECTLMISCSAYAVRENCSSSVYMKLVYARESSQHFFSDQTYAVSYSTSCHGKGCEVTAYCPYSHFVIDCEAVHPSRSTGIFIPTRNTNGFCVGYSNGPEVQVEAICSSRVKTFGYYPEIANGSVSWAECPENTTIMGCSCYSESWTDLDACRGFAYFKPTFSFYAPPRCEIENAGDAARIGAICAEGQQKASLRNTRFEIPAASTEEVQYCGWASSETVQSTEADCRGWMQDPSDEHVGGCKTTECLDLADCVKKCSSCGECAGVLHVDNGAMLYPAGGIQCVMLAKETEPAVSEILQVSGRGTVLYVNTRHPACAPSHDIKRLSLFQDEDCTVAVYPDEVKADGTTIQSSWSTLQEPYVPSCSPHCPISEILLSASFLSPTSVQCAIVHSTLGFTGGWEMQTPKGLVGTSTGPRVSLGQTPSDPASFEKGTTVMFEGPMVLWCVTMISECAIPRSKAPILSWRLAQMFGIPQHMLFLETGLARSQWSGDFRRLQDDVRVNSDGVLMGFRIHIKIVIDTPMHSELVRSIAADLKAMQAQKKLLGEVLTRFLPMKVEVGSFGDFNRQISKPVRRSFPLTTTTTTTTILTEAQEEENDDGLIIALTVLGVAASILSSCMTLLLLINRRLRRAKAQREKEEARRVSSVGPSAVVIGGKAMVRTQSRDLVLPLSEEALRYLPSYWTSAREALHLSYALVSKDYLAFSHLLYASHEHLQLFQDLVNFTYRGIVTQDRLCPSGVHNKTRGGCSCVQPGGNPGLPTGFQVKRVIRIEDADKYSRYIQRRKEINEKRDFCESPDPPVFTSDALAQLSGMSEILTNLNEDINEVYMWHGAPLRIALQIAREDFQMAFAGSGAGTMYGKALYFSESATKADEYAKNEPDGHYADVRALLLCRVCLGKYHYTLDREPAAEQKFQSGESDSTFGDRAKSVGTYREVAIYDPSQVYPEYLVLYERLHGGARQTLQSKDVPFLLELPLYWKNVAKNPYTEGFREHWMVKIAIKELIQRLANGSCRGRAPVVQSVRRIEDSVLWCRYINWKRNLSKLLQSDNLTSCVPPHELDETFGGEVLTAKIQAEAQGYEAISVDNMAPGLNELLLWHGTSRQAAESIAEEGFMVNENHVHGRRFGPGIYLAEDLTKSMSYCKKYDGVLYVLLCRAVCGHMHYTEEDHNFYVGEQARAEQKTCVLANPKRNGPREYILFDASQVYPEYILELRP